MIEITCTQCGQRLKIARPTSPVQVTCPKCNQVLKVGAQPAPTNPGATQPVPAPVAAQPPAQQPPTPQPTPQPFASGPMNPSAPGGFPAANPSAPPTPRHPGGTSSKLPLALIIGGAVCALILVGGGIAYVVSSGGNEQTANTNPVNAGPFNAGGPNTATGPNSSRPRFQGNSPGAQRAAEMRAKHEAAMQQHHEIIAQAQKESEAAFAAAQNQAQTQPQSGASTTTSNQSGTTSDTTAHVAALNQFLTLAKKADELVKIKEKSKTTEMRQQIAKHGEAMLAHAEAIRKLPPLSQEGRTAFGKVLRGKPYFEQSRFNASESQLQAVFSDPSAKNRNRMVASYINMRNSMVGTLAPK